jgi:hypothetical protein
MRTLQLYLMTDASLLQVTPPPQASDVGLLTSGGHMPATGSKSRNMQAGSVAQS